MWNARLDESQAGIKLPERGEKEKDWQEINLKYADDTTLMAESEEETESLDEGEREWTETQH